ncbi:MAG: inositol monophosphatase, partial [Proteobacteria bacterium]|nr:inositol monophosphatase [Pseudomonadota bacterium]
MDAGEVIAERLRVAEALAREGGALALAASRDRASLAIERKGLQDLVTAADKAVEALIVARLREAFPADNVLGEEGGFSQQGAPDAPLWAIDPIDGTANFARGLPLWCVSVGVIHGGRAVAGAIYNPVTDELHAGGVGVPATLNGAPIRV